MEEKKKSGEQMGPEIQPSHNRATYNENLIFASRLHNENQPRYSAAIYKENPIFQTHQQNRIPAALGQELLELCEIKLTTF